jgi:hypothetical protein
MREMPERGKTMCPSMITRASAAEKRSNLAQYENAPSTKYLCLSSEATITIFVKEYKHCMKLHEFI